MTTSQPAADLLVLHTAFVRNLAQALAGARDVVLRLKHYSSWPVPRSS